MRALNFPPKPQVTQSRKVEVIFLAERNRKRLQIALDTKQNITLHTLISTEVIHHFG